MKNIIKKSLKIWAIVVSVVCSIVGVPMVLAAVEKKTGYKRLKALVQQVYMSEEVQACIKELKLKEIPVLKFEKLNGAVMENRSTYHYDSLFTIIKTTPNYTIYVDLSALSKYITHCLVNVYTLKQSTIISVIKFALLHECKHIQQFQEKFWIGYTATDFYFGGYGEQRHEKDANEFAVSCAGMHEKALMKFLKYQQETAGKVFTNDEERLYMSRDLWREQNPLMYIWHMFMSDK